MRTLIVSNRLPVTLRIENEKPKFSVSSGGLATAMRSVHGSEETLWIGWPGELPALEDAGREQIEAELLAQRTVPVFLSQAEVRRYYDGFSNGVLWPLCHYLLDRVRFDAERDFGAYLQVNERFAEVVAQHYRPGDRIWVHDYQLTLLPTLLRRRLPSARIGFFLHIPFPSAEVFRILPWREQILEGLLGADLIGFHTASFAYQFAYSAAQILGAEQTEDQVRFAGLKSRIGAYPISVDAREFDRLAQSPEVEHEVAAIRAEVGDKVLVLGVDRLDYTKGIPERIAAVARLLEREPAFRERLHYIQVAVPTREQVDSYQEYRKTVNELVGRVNAQFGTGLKVPIHFLYRSVTPEQLAAFYRAAEIMLVTPLRDGMNLVAKEYIASRVAEDGVLVLSEFAGAATELREAVLVNPYDTDALVGGLKQALEMAEDERKVRMRALRARVFRNDVLHWVTRFLDDLSGLCAAGAERERRPPAPLLSRISELQRAAHLILILDYDGTLVPFAEVPDLALPDRALLSLITRLLRHPNTAVHVVSGRSRESLARWFEHLPIGLYAEHGYWQRPLGSAEWHGLGPVNLAWKDKVRGIMAEIAERTNGSLMEEKSTALAWHYRATEPALAATRLRELRERLEKSPERDQFELLSGSKVLEARLRGVSKARAARAILAEATESAVFAAGDDTTDEELFLALPAHALTVHVGRGDSNAEYSVPNPHALRRLLESLLSSGGS